MKKKGVKKFGKKYFLYRGNVNVTIILTKPLTKCNNKLSVTNLDKLADTTAYICREGHEVKAIITRFNAIIFLYNNLQNHYKYRAA